MANYTGNSVVDYLKSQGQDSSYSARKKLATSMGISNYSGTASQNTQLLKALRNGQTTTNNTNNTNTTSNTSNTNTTTNTSTKTEEKTTTSKASKTTEKSPLLGVDADLYNKVNDASFTASKNVSKADKTSKTALSNLEDLTSKEDIISSDVWNDINNQFVVPYAVTEADAFLSSQLAKIQSGKTSYSDQLKDIMAQIQNREKFSYDVDTDPLFQQALASAMNSGKQAMQDTIGQASALTGGYGSTYATTAGNQAYNAFIEDAYDNLPQYYQMALEAYQAEGDEMYRQYTMISDADSKEYDRTVAAYDATSQYRNQIYNEAYNMYRDSKNDAFAMANLQLSEHGQKVSDAYNYYSASSDYADKLYEREYTEWADSINMAWKEIEALNTEAWSNKNFDEDVRRFNEGLAENQRQREWQSAEAEKERAFTASENAKSRAASRASSGSRKSSTSDSSLKSPTETQMKNALKAYNESGNEGFNKYVNSIPDNVDKDAIVQYIAEYGELPYSQRTYTVIDDGGVNWGWGIDNNAKVKDQYGNEYTLKQLKNYDEDIAKELSKKEYKKGSTYTKK